MCAEKGAGAHQNEFVNGVVCVEVLFCIHEWSSAAFRTDESQLKTLGKDLAEDGE